MRITREMLSPSRDDAVRINRAEKMAMIVLAYSCTILEDLKTDLHDRLGMIENGTERLNELSANADALLHDLRVTIPINQRMNLQNTAQDFEIRLSPKAAPCKTNVVMQKTEFKELVDYARSKCVDCMDSDEECGKCGLYQLLTVVLPLDNYHDGMLCPYNMGEWAN